MLIIIETTDNQSLSSHQSLPQSKIFSAEFDVEVCRRSGGSRRTRQPPVVRYRHRNTNKYICFSRKGRVRVWVSLSLSLALSLLSNVLCGILEIVELSYSSICQFLALRFSSNELLARCYANIIISSLQFALLSCYSPNKTDACLPIFTNYSQSSGLLGFSLLSPDHLDKL